MEEVKYRVKRIQTEMEERFARLEFKLDNLGKMREVVEDTHELQKKSSEKDVHIPDLLKKINAFTETVLSKDKDSKKKKVVNPPKTRASKKNEKEEEKEEENEEEN